MTPREAIQAFARKQAEIWQDNLRKVRATGERSNRHGYGDGSLYRHITQNGVKVTQISPGRIDISSDIPMYGIYFSVGVGRGTPAGTQSESHRKAALWLQRGSWFKMLAVVKKYITAYIRLQLQEAWK